MKEKTIPTTFSFDFVGQLEKINELISKVRVRIYYRGGNRNGTWITDDFANKLNLSLPHIPIVGTYDPEVGDFLDHTDEGQKKAYGFIPNETNFAWEIAEDGKEYAAVDAYLWVGYWEEAAKIVNKQQSMEILPQTISGDWKVINGEYYFVYQNAAFKGLCPLGDAVVPCFENSQFYTLDEESRSFFQSLNEINEKQSEGGEKMEDKDNAEFNANEETVDTDTTVPVEESVEETATPIVDTSSESNGEFEAESNSEETVIENADSNEEFSNETESEPAGEDSPEEANPVVEDTQDFEAKYTEATQTIESLNRTIVGLQEQVADLQTQNTQYTEEISGLKEYKDIMVKQEKESIVNNFKKKLSDEEIAEVVESIDTYTTEELRTKLSVILADKTLLEEPDVESNSTQYVSVPGTETGDGTIRILRQHKNKKQK